MFYDVVWLVLSRVGLEMVHPYLDGHGKSFRGGCVTWDNVSLDVDVVLAKPVCLTQPGGLVTLQTEDSKAGGRNVADVDIRALSSCHDRMGCVLERTRQRYLPLLRLSFPRQGERDWLAGGWEQVRLRGN